jgi:raffinose/stachyose/melibiose transport system permease protein
VRVLKHAVLVVAVLFAVLPLTILLANSLRTNAEIIGFPLGLPLPPHAENYPAAWASAKFSVAFRNSLIVSLATVAGVGVLGSMSAYALARLRPRGSDLVATYYLLAITVPAQLYLVPLFFAWARLGLVDNLLGLVPIYWAIYLPFGTFLLRSYFLTIPAELEDAARVDGCSELQVLWHVVAPIAAPVVLTLGVIVSVWSWNEFLFAATMLRSESTKTITLSFMAFTSNWEVDFAQQSAAAVMVALPVMALYVGLQRRFVQGMVQGGLKT